MLGSRLRNSAAILGLATAMAAASWGTMARAQYVSRGPSYEQALLRRLDSGMERPGDLAKLTRLVVLETISMQAFARRDLAYSPEGERLLGRIDDLLQTSAVFDAIAWGAPLDVDPRDAFAGFEDAYGRVESDLGGLPGLAPITSMRLLRVTRLLSEIEGRVNLGPPALRAPAIPVAATSPYSPLHLEARGLIGRVDDLLNVLRPTARPPLATSAALTPGLQNLRALVEGFDRFLQGGPTASDLRSTFDPIRRRARRVNATVLQQVKPAEVANRWRLIQDAIDRLSQFFGDPKTIDLTPPSPAVQLPSPAETLALDLAVGQFESFLGEIQTASAGLPHTNQVKADAQRQRTLLFQLRQDLVWGAPRSQVAPRILALETSGRQLANRVRGPQDRPGDRARSLNRVVDALRGQDRSAATIARQ